MLGESTPMDDQMLGGKIEQSYRDRTLFYLLHHCICNHHRTRSWPREHSAAGKTWFRSNSGTTTASTRIDSTEYQSVSEHGTAIAE